ncbi:hypothetical protein [Paludisphaera rhizosphaerae]|uniref:hypothetical protein n=1 Tax=Paludisphaera rhizosphaerae TaxID=2711216 RepID=UPI0013EA1023|nr:hypothetical protein [Paludisphaera rhizosphaerae]
MSDQPIKFRCYRCGKLLGAPSRRAGSTTACPQCRAEIQVPEPTQGEPEPPEQPFLVPDEPGVVPEFAAIVGAATPDVSAIPPIRYDVPSIRPTETAAPRAQDVVLPPAVVLAWSMLVLAAIPLAFIAGLLVGHFLWK